MLLTYRACAYDLLWSNRLLVSVSDSWEYSIRSARQDLTSGSSWPAQITEVGKGAPTQEITSRSKQTVECRNAAAEGARLEVTEDAIFGVVTGSVTPVANGWPHTSDYAVVRGNNPSSVYSRSTAQNVRFAERYLQRSAGLGHCNRLGILYLAFGERPHPKHTPLRDNSCP